MSITTAQIQTLFSEIDYLTLGAIGANQGGVQAEYNALLANEGSLSLAQAIQAIEQGAYAQTYVDPVIRIYQAAFDRVPDQAGVSYWVNQFATVPGAMGVMATTFANSAEFGALYGGANASTLAATSGLGAVLVTDLYQNVLGRTPDPQGLLFWEQSGLNASQLLQAFSTSLEFVQDSQGALINYQNLEAAGTPPLPPTSLLSLATIFTLTTAPTDNIVIAGTTASIVSGVAGSPGTETYQTGDNIVGNGHTIVDIFSTGMDAIAPLVPINNVAAVNVIATASNTYNAAQWTNVALVALTSSTINSVEGSVTGLSNAPLASTYELNTPGVNASLNIGFGQKGAGNFIINGSGAAGDAATLDATGNAGGVNGFKNALTSAAISTSGANWDVINLGTNVANLTMVGTGGDNFWFGPLAAAVAVNFGGEVSSENLTFSPGAFNSSNHITGGSGNNDTVTALGTTGTAHLTMSGVENYVTSFLGANGGFDGTNVTGLHTLTANQPAAIVPVSLTNMASDFTTLTINGAVGYVSVSYAHDPVLTVNYGPSTIAVSNNLAIFAGLAVNNVDKLTVDFYNGTNIGGPIGLLTIDPVHTTDVTLIESGSTFAVLAFDQTGQGDNLFNLTVESTGMSGTMFLSPGAHQSGLWEPIFNVNTFNPEAFGAVVVSASNIGSGAFIGALGSVIFPIAPTFTGTDNAVDIGGSLASVAVTASGLFSTAEINGPSTGSGVYAGGPIGTVSVLAAAPYSTAEISGGFGGVVQGSTAWPFILGTPAGIGPVSVSATGTHGLAAIAGGLWGIATSGDLTSLVVNAGDATNALSLASSMTADAYVAGVFGTGVAAQYTIGSVTVTAVSDNSEAQIYGLDGNGVTALNNFGQKNLGGKNVALGHVTLTASGLNSTADIRGDFIGVAAFGEVQSVNVTASNTLAFAQIWGGSTGLFAAQEIGNLTILASGINSEAEIQGDDGVQVLLGGINVLNETASGINSQAEIDGLDGGEGIHLLGGDLGLMNLIASGVNSDAHVYGSERGIDIVVGDIGTLNLVASAQSSVSHIYGGGASFGVGVSVFGDVTTLTLLASGNGDFVPGDDSGGDAHIDGNIFGLFVGGNVKNLLSITASGVNSTAYIGHYNSETSNFSNGLHWGSNEIDGHLNALSVIASGPLSTAHLYKTWVGNGVGMITDTASGIASTTHLHIDTFGGNYIGAAIGPVTVTASGGFSTANFTYGGDTPLTTIMMHAATSTDTAHLWLNLNAGNGTYLGNAYTGATGTDLHFNQSGVITAASPGTDLIDIYGQSVISINASGNSGYFADIVHNPLLAGGAMTITTGTGFNLVEVGDGSGATDSNTLGSNQNHIILTAGGHNVIDFNNLTGLPFPNNSTAINETVTGFVSGLTTFSFGTTEAATLDTAGHPTNFDGSQGYNYVNLGVVTGNAAFPTAEVNMVVLADAGFAIMNGNFGAGPDYAFAVADGNGYLMYNGGSGTTVTLIVELVGVSDPTAFHATDIVHNLQA